MTEKADETTSISLMGNWQVKEHRGPTSALPSNHCTFRYAVIILLMFRRVASICD